MKSYGLIEVIPWTEEVMKKVTTKCPPLKKIKKRNTATLIHMTFYLKDAVGLYL